MEQGWIKLSRKLIEWEWFDNSNMVKLFIYLLLKANHKENSHQGTKIKRGQIKTGLDSLSSALNIPKQQLRTCLKNLEKTGEINTQSTNKYRIITVCKYDSYQNDQQATNIQTNTQPTSNQQATNKQLTANKNDKNKKNDNNDKEIYKAFDHLKISFDEVDKLKTKGYSQQQIDNVLLSIENYKKNTSYKSLYLTASKWLQKEEPQNKINPPKMVY
jgi:hypothetical protein